MKCAGPITSLRKCLHSCPTDSIVSEGHGSVIHMLASGLFTTQPFDRFRLACNLFSCGNLYHPLSPPLAAPVETSHGCRRKNMDELRASNWERRDSFRVFGGAMTGYGRMTYRPFGDETSGVNFVYNSIPAMLDTGRGRLLGARRRRGLWGGFERIFFRQQ